MTTKSNPPTDIDFQLNSIIHSVGAEGFEQNILNSPNPVLLLCIHPGSELAGQIAVLKQIADEFNRVLDFYLLAEEFIETFMDRYGVTGTPTFFIFQKGEEKGRLLGHADSARVIQFLSENLT